MRRFILSACVVFGVAAGLCSCAATPNPRAGRFVVSAAKSSFYKYGPAQTFGPDFALVKGQKLTLVEENYGYSRVMLDDGTAGYVATEDIAPAPKEIAPADAPRLASRRSGGGPDAMYGGPNRKSRPVDRVENSSPLFDVFDVPLPTNPDSAPEAPKPAPKFKTPNLKVQ